MRALDLPDRSRAFDLKLAEILGKTWWETLPTDYRYRTCVVAARLSMDHARAARSLLLELAAPHSGASAEKA